MSAARVLLATAALAIAAAAVSQSQTAAPRATAVSRGIADVQGIRVGHFTLAARPTGCTVVLVEGDGAVGGVSQRGGAPGTRETDLLDPLNMVDRVNAVVLSGGSAFGLDAAQGVVKYLEERRFGWKVGAAGVVPIVPAAILFDLGFGGDGKIRPTADCGYKAATAASNGAVSEGNVGAGAGATVGKLGGAGRAMKGGLGSASIALPNGLIVGAIAAVNAAGDVIDPASGKVVAGVRTQDGKGLADVRALIRAGSIGTPAGPRAGGNTTIAVVATN
ncbi:MAG TPA: P1 family peptidase, partial [Gemmatimonadales bacterium]|nr:P1 family peptidase [Gemmatimonadales bacterium]